MSPHHSPGDKAEAGQSKQHPVNPMMMRRSKAAEKSKPLDHKATASPMHQKPAIFVSAGLQQAIEAAAKLTS
jgi:hypothetical protein